MMDFSECLELEIVNKSPNRILIYEDNVKGKRTNRDFKIGKSFQYSSQSFENRFLIWKIDNNILSIAEWSTDYELLGNQIEIEFQKSQVLFVNVFETENDVQFLITTSLLVMKFSVHHPKILRHPNSENFQYSIFYGLTDLNEMKYFVTAYFNANEITSVNSIIDFSNKNAYFNYGLSNGTIYTFIIEELIYRESIHYFEMKESSLFSKLWSGIVSRPKGNEYVNTSILDMTYVVITGQIYIVSISRDNKLKLWSLKDRCFVLGEELLDSALEANPLSSDLPIINYNSIIASHRIRPLLRSSSLSDTVVVHFHVTIGALSLSNWIVVQLVDRQSMQILSNISHKSEGLTLIDFELGYNAAPTKRHGIGERIGIWSLACQSNIDDGTSHFMKWVPLFEDIAEDNEQYSVCRIFNGSSAELEVVVENHQDSQEAIMDKIFRPGTFLRSAIVNTLNKYRQIDQELFMKTSFDELKQNMVQLIESLVERELIVFLSEEEEFDVLELNRKQWLNMLKNIVEEHYRLMEPLGIIRVAGTIGLCRYGTVSLMRTANELERTLSSLSISESLYRFFDQRSIVSGCTLLRYLHDLSNQIQCSDVWPSIENLIFRLQLRTIDIVPLLQFIVPSVIDSRLDNDPHIIEQTVHLLDSLDIINTNSNMESKMEQCRGLSSLSVGLLHYSLCQVIRDRICITLAMIALLQRRGSTVTRSDSEALICRLECSMKSLVAIYWILTVRQKSSSELTDLQKNQLESLNLLENRCSDLVGTDILCFTVFTKSFKNRMKIVTNSSSIGWQTKNTTYMSMIIDKLHPLSDQFVMIQICRYFLSYNMPLELIDYLKFLSCSEPRGWWMGGETGFVKIIIGIAYLLLDKYWKAVDCFMAGITESDASSLIMLQEIILQKGEIISRKEDEIPSSLLQVKLILKFIEVVSSVTNPEPYLIVMAEAATKIIDRELSSHDLLIVEAASQNQFSSELSRCKSNLMNILFKNLLDIGRYGDARLAIMENPDCHKQQNCLREFISSMFDKNQLELLVQFDYGSLSEEFVNVLYCRARASVNIVNGNTKTHSQYQSFYNVLYSYYCCRGNYKLAATCMLELALRLDQDLRNQGIYMSNTAAIEHLQMQVKAYLACITVANLIPVGDDRLFVFPSSIAAEFISDDMIGKIPIVAVGGHLSQKDKQNLCDTVAEVSMESLDAEDMSEEEHTQRTIINLQQIKCQYNLIRTRLKVLRESPEHGFIQSGKLMKSLTLSSLLQMGLYWDAIKLSIDFDMDMSTIVSCLATRCAHASKNYIVDGPVLKEKENIIDSLEEISGNVDFACRGGLQKLLWKLLEQVLFRYDTTPNGDLSMKACSKLLSGGIEMLPSWFINFIVDEKQAIGALLRLYVVNGYMEPAIALVSRVLDKEIDLLFLDQELCAERPKNSLIKEPQPRWICYSDIFNLMEILEKMAENNRKAQEFHQLLEEKMRIMVNLGKENTLVPAILSG